MQQSAVRRLVGGLAVAAATLLTVALATPANAAAPTRFRVVPLVSDQAGRAPLVDADLVNAWGLALSPTSPLWVANNGTNTATIYAGGVNGATPTKAALTVTIPGGAPTGEVFNDTTDFVLPESTGGTGKALFMFASEGGDITAWNGSLGTHAAVVAHVDGAIFKGLAIVRFRGNSYLLAPDFHNARVDVFDAGFHFLPHASHLLADPRLPAGYAPFNVFVPMGGHSVYLTFAKQGPDAMDELHGPGLGFVDRFDTVTGERERVASHGTLNAPWGMAVAPASFGRFAGALLVGNFGDGRIGAYRDGHFLGLLRANDRHPVAIDGLWGLLPGTPNTGGTGALWFSSGPDDEQHGLVGQILPA